VNLTTTSQDHKMVLLVFVWRPGRLVSRTNRFILQELPHNTIEHDIKWRFLGRYVSYYFL